MSDHSLARGKVDGRPIYVGDQVMVRAEVLVSHEGVGALLRFYSKTDEQKVWVAEGHLRYAVVDADLPDEPPDGTILHVDGLEFPDGSSRIFIRDDAEGHSDDRRRHDEHWFDVTEQRWIDWPHAVDRGAARSSARRMALLSAEETEIDIAALDGAMHTCWLEGRWTRMTKKMTAAEREAAAAAVERYSERLEPGATLTTLRWWNE